MKKNQSQAFANSRFSGHRTRECPWFPGGFCTRLNGSRGGCCEQSQLDSAPQETSAGDGRREQRVPQPSPSPRSSTLCHPYSRRVGRGGQPLSLAQGESPIRRLPEPSPPRELGHSGLCKMGSPGSLVHLSTQMFGHLIKVSKPPKYPPWGC